MSTNPSTESRPLIDLSQPRYPQSTYFGRVRHFLDVIDPRTLILSTQSIEASRSLVNSYLQSQWKNIPPTTSVQDLWDAKKIVSATIHPDTGVQIPPYVRFSAFVPMNIPLVVGMLGSTSPASVFFWQWMNQSYNVAVNYANRNASNQLNWTQLATAYAGAVASSCSIAIGLNKVVARVDDKKLFTPLFRSVFRNIIPFIAVGSAGALNVFLMRRNEIYDGIKVQDQYGETVGTSVQAGRKGLMEVAMTRVALPAPILLFPPLIMNTLDSLGLFKAKPKIRPPVNVVVITACLWAALPLAIGLFPQVSTVPVEDLEPEFHNKLDSKGNKLTKVYFNKGL